MAAADFDWHDDGDGDDRTHAESCANHLARAWAKLLALALCGGELSPNTEGL